MKGKNIFFKKRKFDNQKVIAIAGNPNVGKSTIFNALTGMHQHTGNWPGKTVSNAIGFFEGKNNSYKLVDIPGTYSLLPQSAEEELARDYICFENPDAVLVVCDAGCIEKNLNLVLQILEVNKDVLLCVNLIDEAKKKGITVDIKKIEKHLGIPVIAIVAHQKNSVLRLISFLDDYFLKEQKSLPKLPIYTEKIENELKNIEREIKPLSNFKEKNRWISLKILEDNETILNKISKTYKIEHNTLKEISKRAEMAMEIYGISRNDAVDEISKQLVFLSKKISNESVIKSQKKRVFSDNNIDKIFTGKITAIPIMLIMVAFIFWITIQGANYLSNFLASFVFIIEQKLKVFCDFLAIPTNVSNPIIYGGYRVFGWVVSVMLPPMAIFFPFFTILEDSGYLARVAYNLDRPFARCNACGKQALTMCMGFGCNSVGVMGARIIDSKRERLLSIITNSFMPCNGRFPMLITIITIFLIGTSVTLSKSLTASAILSLIIFFAVLVTFFVTCFLSKTLLKGESSAYILELPSYRKPQFSKIIVRSFFDRTIFVLARAIVTAIPMGFLIYILGNCYIGNQSILQSLANFLTPFGNFLGMDGVILLAFLLGIPANEIVVPIMLMLYTSSNMLNQVSDYGVIHSIFVNNGWDIKTAICVILFAVFHWPCATTLFSIKKETASYKWTLLSALIPTIIGMIFCIIVNLLFKIIS